MPAGNFHLFRPPAIEHGLFVLTAASCLQELLGMLPEMCLYNFEIGLEILIPVVW